MTERRGRDEGSGARREWPLLNGAELARAQARAARGPAAERAAASRASMQRAALALAGEVGYREMTVAALLERGGSNRDSFYRTFGDKLTCYTDAYALASEELFERVLAAGSRGADWPEGMRVALRALVDFVGAEPALARGILAEVHVAGGAALEKRRELLERLSRAIDRARRETDLPRHSSPPITPVFILSGIEATVIRCLRIEGRDLESELPGLVYMSVVFYFGPTRAMAEFFRAKEGSGPQAR
jgi:AcrR family transcriptional regulator